MRTFRKLIGTGFKRGKAVKYRIGEVEITLPAGHALPGYQSSFRLYDRFLLSVGRVALEGWIVDIGANVGDSAAAFVSGPPKNLLCIEPHKPFLAALEKNRTALESGGSHVVVEPVAVTRNVGAFRLDANNSTARLVPGPSAASEHLVGETLDGVVKRVCADDPVAFIKCDVDGFDAEALLSGTETLSLWRPAVYFECDAAHDQHDSYLELFELLRSLGYELKTFDNFGMPLLDVESERAFGQLLNYTASLKARQSQQTIYYVDCFAFPPESSTATEILRDYNDLVRVG